MLDRNTKPNMVVTLDERCDRAHHTTATDRREEASSHLTTYHPGYW
jgi:hypothetical protein